MDAATNPPGLARGLLVEIAEGSIGLNLPGTDYRLHLLVDAPVKGGELNKPIDGRILARAKRVDIVHTGGRYIEPVYGRPRRIQGRVIATDQEANTITVNCGTPFVCYLTADQKPRDFEIGSLVSFDIERGAQFEPRNSKSKVQSTGSPLDA